MYKSNDFLLADSGLRCLSSTGLLRSVQFQDGCLAAAATLEGQEAKDIYRRTASNAEHRPGSAICKDSELLP